MKTLWTSLVLMSIINHLETKDFGKPANHLRFKRSNRQSLVANYTVLNCNNKDDVMFLEKIETDPSPLVFEGVTKIKLSLKLLQEIEAPIQVDVRVEAIVSNLFNRVRKITFPCKLLLSPLNMSCPIQDICETEVIKGRNCTYIEKEETFPCSCPLKKGIVSFDDIVIKPGLVPNRILQFMDIYEPEGTVKIVATRNGINIGCASVIFNIYSSKM